MRESSNAPLLHIAPFHLSPVKASELVIRLLKAIGIKRPAGRWESQTYARNTQNGIISLHFREMMEEARRGGRVGAIQDELDLVHPIFGGTFGMEVSGPYATIGMQFAGYEKHFRGPARQYPVEQELAEDILAFRTRACEASAPPNFAETVRYYRAYLFCCTTLVDAFVNRFIHIAKFKKMIGPQFDQLCESTNTEERIELWMAIFTKHSFSALKDGIQWDHFKKLRTERNRHIHAVEPFFGYEIAKLSTVLNYCQEGVGGLLLKMLKLADHKPYSVLERLHTAPTARYISKR